MRCTAIDTYGQPLSCSKSGNNLDQFLHIIAYLPYTAVYNEQGNVIIGERQQHELARAAALRDMTVGTIILTS